MGARHRSAPAVVAARPRRPAAHRHRGRTGHRRRGRRPSRTPHGHARGRRSTAGCCRSTASACSSRAPTSCPPGRGWPTPTPAMVRGDVERAVEAGLDALRVQAHIARPELYQAADELGIVLLQDFPLQWGYQRGVRREAVRQAREAVDALGPPSRPSCSGAPTTSPTPTASRAINPVGAWPVSVALAARQLPSWNRSVLDRWVKRAFEQADPTRPVVAHGGVGPNLPRLDGTDRHLWLGWRTGAIGDLAERARLVPKSVRFVSEFGAQSVPDTTERVDRSGGVAPPRLGRAGPSSRSRRRSPDGAVPTHRSPDLRGVAHGDAAVSGSAAA